MNTTDTPDSNDSNTLLGLGSSDVLGPDGKLHADGYFTWHRRDGYVLDAKLPAEFVLADKARAVVDELRDAVRSARADEAHCWARRVDALTSQLREVDARYMALLKAVADGVAMQPKAVILQDTRGWRDGVR